MRNIIFYTVCRELAFNGLLRTAGSVSIGITALDHESGDDTMESQTIVEAFICQIDKVGYRNRGSICIQFQRNRAIVLHIDGHMMKTCEQFSVLRGVCCVSGSITGLVSCRGRFSSLGSIRSISFASASGQHCCSKCQGQKPYSYFFHDFHYSFRYSTYVSF